MSVNILRLIPTSPDYVPDLLSQERAVALLKSQFLPNPGPLSEVTARVTEQVEFIDQGENFERIVCPFCSSELAAEWWQGVMDDSYEGHFADLRITTPCCHTESSLNDLLYEWPAGFARFVLAIRDPILEPTHEMLDILERLLGCRIRVIWAHY